ncbi:hypothetical protein [uncultured Actinomyces sp.]|jgi:hypothetical protein avisC_07239|uniref:hypothetical protein n=1 Tax=uncultured Actinomyces sp. TaxID=249061 RepID=UPI0025DA9DAD|nr:hypothetical protein [uncultured Actinomyces sp.]
MTASTEASSDSDTDVDGEAVVDHLPHDDATDDTAPGQDAGVGPASLAFTSFLLALLCLSPFYMLGSNLWDLINGRGLLLGQALSSLTLHVAGLAISSDYLTLGNPQGQSLSGFIPTGNDIPILKSVIILILATHLLLALHRVYQRSSTLAAENTVLRKETEGLV